MKSVLKFNDYFLIKWHKKTRTIKVRAHSRLLNSNNIIEPLCS